MRAILAAALAGTALVAVGCGSSSSYGAGGDSLSTASLAPKNAAVWIAIATDRASTQWKALDELLKKIPGAETAIDDPNSSPFVGTSFRRDVLPAIGRQLVLVVPSNGTDPIFLAKPDEPGKLDAILAKTKEHEVTGEVDGWTAIANSQKELDAYKTALAKGTLAESDALKVAMQGLSADALARGYVEGSDLTGLAGQAASLALSAGPGIATATSGVGALVGVGTGTFPVTSGAAPKSTSLRGSAGFTVTASDRALRFEVTIDVPKGQVPASYKPTLLDNVPADALVAVSFHGGTAITGQLKDAAGADALRQVEKQLGVSLDDIGAALDGECVLYVRAGSPIPEITLAVRPSDPARAKATLDKIVESFGKQAAGSIPIKGLELTTATVGGVVIVSTSKGAAASFGSGPKLTETDRFKQAAGDVGLGDTTAGFAYVDVRGLGPLLKTALGSLGASSDTTGGLDLGSLSAVDSLAVNATVDGSRIHVQGVVRVS